MSDHAEQRAGMVALAGRPNVGKSTLLNALVDQRISSVTPKPQTTRHRIVGVRTEGALQIAFVDAPGMHAGPKSALNRAMNEAAASSLVGVDLVLLVIDAARWHADDDRALARIVRAGAPCGLVVNKVDRVRDKNTLLPLIQSAAERHDFAFVVPVSASRRDNLTALLAQVGERMPAARFLFDADDVTDRSLRFIAAETVREKLTLFLAQELPYRIAVEIERFDEQDPGMVRIHAVVWVARDNQKSIVIGANGAMLKQIGRSARLALEDQLETRVDLQLWVRVARDWPEHATLVNRIGY